MNAEALYKDLLKHLQESLFKETSTSAVHLAGMAIGGAWIAKKELKQLKLQTPCPLNYHLMSIMLILF